GHVLFELPAENLADILELRQGDSRDARAGKRHSRQRAANLLVADPRDVFFAAVRGLGLRPGREQCLGARGEPGVAFARERVELGGDFAMLVKAGFVVVLAKLRFVVPAETRFVVPAETGTQA